MNLVHRYPLFPKRRQVYAKDHRRGAQFSGPGLFQVFSVLQSAAERSRPSKRIEVRVLLVALASTLWLAGTAAQSQPISREQAAQSLSQADAQARREAAGRLGEVGTRADVPLLVETLRDPDADTRDRAEQALWRIWARSGDPETDRLYQAGIEQMNAGDLQQSIITFTRIVELKPDFAEGWNKRATLYFLVGDLRKSLADCDEVMKRNPYHFGALSGYALIYARLEYYDRALEYSRRALAVLARSRRSLRGRQLEHHRHGAVVDHLDLHPGAEPSRGDRRAPGPQVLHEGVDQGLGHGAGSRGHPGRPAALAGVAVQGELADDESRRRGQLGESPVHHPGLVIEDPQAPHLVGQAPGQGFVVTVGHAHQHAQPWTHGTEDLAARSHLGPRHPLHQRPHRYPSYGRRRGKPREMD